MRMENFKKLSQYLREENKQSITLGFLEIENIIGEMLPKVSKTRANWWANIVGDKKCSTWIDAGYVVFESKMITIRHNVTFVKMDSLSSVFMKKENAHIKKLFYFLTDPEAPLHRRIKAIIEILVIPVLTALSVVFSYMAINSASSDIITNEGTIINGDNNSITIAYESTGSIIEIVDISIEEDRFPVLDIKLRNSGDKIAYLYKVEFYMLDYFQMYNIYVENYSEIEPSANYDILLTQEKKQKFNISQAIPNNDVDRFTLSLASSTGDPFIPAICYFYIKLYYNNDEYVESLPMIIPITNPRELGGKYVAYTDLAQAKRNYIELCRFNEYDAIKSPYFLGILQSYEDNKEEFINEKTTK